MALFTRSSTFFAGEEQLSRETKAGGLPPRFGFFSMLGSTELLREEESSFSDPSQ